MSVLERIFAAETAISDLVNPRLWLTEAVAGARTTSGMTVNPQTAVGLSAYFACLRAISEDVGRLPLITYKRKDRGKERFQEHALYSKLHDAPNDMMSSMAWRETITQHAMAWGNGYAHILQQRTAGGLWMDVVHPSRVTIEREGGVLRYKVAADQHEKEYIAPASEMLHIHGLGDDGLVGYSVAKIGAESIGLSLGAQSFGSGFFGNGARPGGVLEYPEELEEEAYKRLQEGWQTRHGGPENASKTAILEHGVTYRPIGIPPEDAQFLETRQFQVEEIARWFRITPHKIQHLLHATYSNVEHLALDYVNDTLMPWLVRWEQEIKRKLFPREPDVFAEHLVAGLLRGDQAARGEYYTKRFQLGTLSQNDIRELENENPIDGGDTYFVPANMVRSQDAAEGKMGNQAPAQSPEPSTGGAPQPRPEAAKSTASGPVWDPVIEDAALRILRKEAKAAGRAYGKHRAHKPAFDAWADRFYREHREFVVETLLPVLRVLVQQGEKTSAAETAARIAQWHCTNSQTRLAQRFGDMDTELGTWEARSKSVVEHIREEVTNDA